MIRRRHIIYFNDIKEREREKSRIGKMIFKKREKEKEKEIIGWMEMILLMKADEEEKKKNICSFIITSKKNKRGKWTHKKYLIQSDL